MPARYSRVFTTSTRVRLHTWRLGLTALILKNCRLSPTISTPPRSSSYSSTWLVRTPSPALRRRLPGVPARPLRRPADTTHGHPSHGEAKLRRFAPSRIKFCGCCSVPPPLRRPVHDDELPRHLAPRTLKHTGTFSPFTGPSIYAGPGLGIRKWREYVDGIFGENCFGVGRGAFCGRMGRCPETSFGSAVLETPFGGGSMAWRCPIQSNRFVFVVCVGDWIVCLNLVAFTRVSASYKICA